MGVRWTWGSGSNAQRVAHGRHIFLCPQKRHKPGICHPQLEGWCTGWSNGAEFPGGRSLVQSWQKLLCHQCQLLRWVLTGMNTRTTLCIQWWTQMLKHHKGMGKNTCKNHWFTFLFKPKNTLWPIINSGKKGITPNGYIMFLAPPSENNWWEVVGTHSGTVCVCV